jgi:signal transduction histidine kinase
MTLRARILLSLAPLAFLIIVLGIAGFLLLDRMGGRIDAILRENYRSVRAMHHMNEATERIDSSFQSALVGREAEAAKQFEAGWSAFDEQFDIESKNITVHPIEDELVEKLRALREDYRNRGRRFHALPAGSDARAAAYLGRPGDPGLLGQFKQIKDASEEILRINQENMEHARDQARETARTALDAFAASLAIVALLVFAVGWYLLRTILGPIAAVTEAAHAIGSGQLDRTVPVFGRDELGRLAVSFNTMTRELKKYRRSNLDRLLRAQQTAQATIDSFPDPVFVVEPAGRVEHANPAARSLFGVGPAPDGGPGPVWQPPEPLIQPLAVALRDQQAYQPEQYDQALSFHLAGEERTFLPQVRPIRDPDGNTLGAAVVMNDVTRFRLLDQFKTDLVATVSHELKTPLTSVRLAVHVLLEEVVGPLTPKQSELLIDARDDAERLLSLIEQLLALARMQHARDRASLVPQDPVELLRAAAEGVRPRAEDKHIEIEVRDGEPLPMVRIDPVPMRQAIGNLLDNAVTYTPAGGRISLSATANEDRVTLSVADTGIGMPAEHLPHVFDRFFRIPGRSDEAGTGLGLAIVKEIVEAHGGDITCRSEPGLGTTFQITLPIRDGGEHER